MCNLFGLKNGLGPITKTKMAVTIAVYRPTVADTIAVYRPTVSRGSGERFRPSSSIEGYPKSLKSILKERYPLRRRKRSKVKEEVNPSYDHLKEPFVV